MIKTLTGTFFCARRLYGGSTIKGSTYRKKGKRTEDENLKTSYYCFLEGKAVATFTWRGVLWKRRGWGDLGVIVLILVPIPEEGWDHQAVGTYEREGTNSCTSDKIYWVENTTLLSFLNILLFYWYLLFLYIFSYFMIWFHGLWDFPSLLPVYGSL